MKPVSVSLSVAGMAVSRTVPPVYEFRLVRDADVGRRRKNQQDRQDDHARKVLARTGVEAGKEEEETG